MRECRCLGKWEEIADCVLQCVVLCCSVCCSVCCSMRREENDDGVELSPELLAVEFVERILRLLHLFVVYMCV